MNREKCSRIFKHYNSVTKYNAVLSWPIPVCMILASGQQVRNGPSTQSSLSHSSGHDEGQSKAEKPVHFNFVSLLPKTVRRRTHGHCDQMWCISIYHQRYSKHTFIYFFKKYTACASENGPSKNHFINYKSSSVRNFLMVSSWNVALSVFD